MEIIVSCSPGGFLITKSEYSQTVCLNLILKPLTLSNTEKKENKYVSLWKNDPTSHLIYDLCDQFPREFMVLIFSYKSSSTERDVNFANYGLEFRVK